MRARDSRGMYVSRTRATYVVLAAMVNKSPRSEGQDIVQNCKSVKSGKGGGLTFRTRPLLSSRPLVKTRSPAASNRRPDVPRRTTTKAGPSVNVA